MYMMHRLPLLLCALPLACAGQVTFTGSPNPFTANANGVGQITLIWSAPGVSTTEVHLFSPSGQLFTRGDSSGSATTGDWVTNGMTFYLQDVSASTPAQRSPPSQRTWPAQLVYRQTRTCWPP